MDVHAGIVDQWVGRIVRTHGARLAARGVDNEDRRRSNGFCVLTMATLLELDEARALDRLTDGGEDGGVDAIHIGETLNDAFTVWLFQAKYHRDLAGTRSFPSGELPKIIQTVATIFDPERPLDGMRDIAHAVEDIRSRIRDGALPQVRVILCSNGVRWQRDGDARIAQAGLGGGQVTWEFVNHADLVLLRTPKDINAVLRFEGDAAVEDLSFRRVFVGRIGVREIAALMDEHGDLLLDRNIRAFLGAQNRVNADMAATLIDPAGRPNFYFYYNGITMICREFQHNALQARNFTVHVKGLQVINGGQTCKTIQRVVAARPGDDYGEAHVLVRLYKIGDDDQGIIDRITYATNSQTPIELQDLRASDEVQRRLVLDVEALGHTYVPKRGLRGPRGDEIGSAEAAEAVMAVWRRRPHVARTAGMKLFDQYYAQIFESRLTGAEVVAAVTVLRDVEERRRQRAYPAWAELFVPYASHHLAMMIGGVIWPARALGHRDFAASLERWRADADRLYAEMIDALSVILVSLFIRAESPSILREAAAAFRGGRLVESLSGGGFLATARDPQVRAAVAEDLEALKRRFAGRGHQLEIDPQGPEEGG